VQEFKAGLGYPCAAFVCCRYNTMIADGVLSQLTEEPPFLGKKAIK
jgi:hypothetical protein